MPTSNTTPVFAVDEKNLIPVSDHLRQLVDIPPSRMFVINKSLKVYQEKNPDANVFDAEAAIPEERFARGRDIEGVGATPALPTDRRTYAPAEQHADAQPSR